MIQVGSASAKIIADSISPEGVRLTTIQLRYPRMVHADFMTHRVFSRNGRSSRAVPFSVLVKEEPYVPEFAKNQAGMVAAEPLTGLELQEARDTWLHAAKTCQEAARHLANLKVHKQWVNRMLEWFGYIDVLVTSTEWNNFFALRDEEGAQPEIQHIAKVVKQAMDDSTPVFLFGNQWHLPYFGTVEDIRVVNTYMVNTYASSSTEQFNEIAKKISVARCARLTIKPFDGDGSIEKELDRYDKLMVSRPVHASPAEHIARPDTRMEGNFGHWTNEHLHGNFTGWIQFRKQIPYNTVI